MFFTNDEGVSITAVRTHDIFGIMSRMREIGLTEKAKLRIFAIEPLAYLVGKMAGRNNQPVYYGVDGMIDAHVNPTLTVLWTTGTSTLG